MSAAASAAEAMNKTEQQNTSRLNNNARKGLLCAPSGGSRFGPPELLMYIAFICFSPFRSFRHTPSITIKKSSLINQEDRRANIKKSDLHSHLQPSLPSEGYNGFYPGQVSWLAFICNCRPSRLTPVAIRAVHHTHSSGGCSGLLPLSLLIRASSNTRGNIKIS